MGTVVAELGEGKMDLYRKEVVFAAFKEAIEAGRRVDCTPEELREIFEEVLYGDGGGEG